MPLNLITVSDAVFLAATVCGSLVFPGRQPHPPEALTMPRAIERFNDLAVLLLSFVAGAILNDSPDEE